MGWDYLHEIYRVLTTASSLRHMRSTPPPQLPPPPHQPPSPLRTLCVTSRSSPSSPLTHEAHRLPPQLLQERLLARRQRGLALQRDSVASSWCFRCLAAQRICTETDARLLLQHPGIKQRLLCPPATPKSALERGASERFLITVLPPQLLQEQRRQRGHAMRCQRAFEHGTACDEHTIPRSSHPAGVDVDGGGTGFPLAASSKRTIIIPHHTHTHTLTHARGPTCGASGPSSWPGYADPFSPTADHSAANLSLNWRQMPAIVAHSHSEGGRGS